MRCVISDGELAKQILLAVFEQAGYEIDIPVGNEGHFVVRGANYQVVTFIADGQFTFHVYNNQISDHLALWRGYELSNPLLIDLICRDVFAYVER